MAPEADRVPQADVLHADYAHHYKPFETSRRKLNYYYFRLQVEGQCQAYVNGEIVAVHPGDLLLYRPGDTAFIRFERTPEQPLGKALISGNYYMSCRGAWLDEWWDCSPKPTKINIPLGESVLSIFKEIVQEQRRMKEKDAAISDYLLRVFCLSIGRTIGELQERGRSTPPLVHRMKQFIMENAASPFRLEDVAKHAGISVPRAVALFKSACNQTIMQYALEVRLSIACDRIKFTMTNLEKIAESTGFGSYTYFHRVFRSRFGISPKQYRERQ
ncbi:AraC family transcriptional regulator [Paenibacillus flagellatus]|nr:AraC family transcriptional regulator [Paenibacillus flagellatus]